MRPIPGDGSEGTKAPPSSPAECARSSRRGGAGAALAAAVCLVLGVAGAGVFLSETSAPPLPEERERASGRAFVDSVGVNVHTLYLDTPYARRDEVRRRLLELGVRHVRDGLEPDRPDQQEALRDLAAQGIRATLITGRPGQGDLLPRLLALASGPIRPAVEALEGPNEFDAAGVEQWAPALRAYQEELHRAVRRSPGLDGVAVVAPSLVERNSRELLGDIAAASEFGNMHPYPGGRPPERNLTGELELASENTGRRPIQATETGYHTALRSGGDHPPVSERAAGIYLPRLFLEYFRRGVTRTFAYELIDEFPDPESDDVESNFGLLRNDLSPKPAFAALANLIHLAAEGGQGRSGSTSRGESPVGGGKRLAFSLEGDLDGVRHLTLERDDGRSLIAVWRDAIAWDVDERRDLEPPPQRVEVRFGEPVARAELFRPSRSGAPEREVTGPRAVGLELGADVAVMVVTPPAPPAGAPPGRRR